MSEGTADVAVGFCLDESGSMGSCWDVTINGFNTYIKSLRGQDGKTTITLTQFSKRPYDALCRMPFVNQPLAGKTVKLTRKNYVPDGGTPLYDAIGHTIKTMDAHLKLLDEQPSVIIVIQTDGFENASTAYDQPRIVKLIRKREKRGWKFIYLGADQDAVTAERVSTGLGVMAGASIGYAGATMDSAFASVGDSTQFVRRSSVAGQSVSSADMASNTRTAYEGRTGVTSYTDPNVAPGPDYVWNKLLHCWTVDLTP